LRVDSGLANMADGEWNKVCALMTAPVPTLLSRLLPPSLLQEDGA
jgi:hypothetical protein